MIDWSTSEETTVASLVSVASAEAAWSLAGQKKSWTIIPFLDVILNHLMSKSGQSSKFEPSKLIPTKRGTQQIFR